MIPLWSPLLALILPRLFAISALFAINNKELIRNGRKAKVTGIEHLSARTQLAGTLPGVRTVAGRADAQVVVQLSQIERVDRDPKDEEEVDSLKTLGVSF